MIGRIAGAGTQGIDASSSMGMPAYRCELWNRLVESGEFGSPASVTQGLVNEKTV